MMLARGALVLAFVIAAAASGCSRRPDTASEGSAGEPPTSGAGGATSNGGQPGDGRPSGGGTATPAAPVETGSAATAAAAAASDAIDLGSYSYRVTTRAPEAQRRFDRGLTLAHAFNHGAAEREFRLAAEADPGCAMAHWGIAYVNGPHINNTFVTPEQSDTAWKAVAKARELAAASGSELERGLIEALGKRYAEKPPEDRRPLDEAYAAAMKEIWRSHGDQAEIGALYAEALMDLHPWDLWTVDGKPKTATEEILATLERAMRLDPKHPLANHLYIHAVEGSPHPERGVRSADMLRDLVPGAGHLVHMPAHIDIRVGRWQDAADANVRAIAADEAFSKTTSEPGFYRIYMSHNRHFLAFTAMMRGRGSDAIQAMREMVARIPPEFARSQALFVDGFIPSPLMAEMRFGKWEEILAEPDYPDYLPVARALRAYIRASALNALDRHDDADKEREAFRALAAAVPKDAIVGNNAAADILSIASEVLDGEIASRRDRFDEAIASLRKAAKAEDRLKYDEPPDWLQPVRHTLGAVLLRAGRYADAEKAYRQDLTRFPENGWSLYGLERALSLQKKDAAAGAVGERFDKAWEGADVKLGSTCLCQPGV